MKERFDPSDTSFSPQTSQHHIKRYEFASKFFGRTYLDLCCGTGYGSNMIKTYRPDSTVDGIDIHYYSGHGDADHGFGPGYGCDPAGSVMSHGERVTPLPAISGTEVCHA